MTRMLACTALLWATGGCSAPQAPVPPAAVAAPASVEPRHADATAGPARAEGAGVAAIAVEPLQLPGRFEAGTSVAELRHAFGADNVTEAEVPAGEGTTEPGVVLFADDPSRRAYVYFREHAPLSRLHAVRVVDEPSQWRLETGAGALRIGDPLARALQLNGGAFAFGGTGWDYGGYAMDWRGGRLAQPWNAARRPSVRFELAEAWLQARGAAPMPIGEGRFDTDAARWPDLDMVVTEIGLRVVP